MGRTIKQNRYVTPELAAQINPVNTQLKQDFVSYLNSLQRSDATIESYVGDLDQTFVWLLQFAKNKQFTDITKRDVMNYQNYLCSNGNSPARVRRVKATLSSLSNFIESVLDDEYPEFRNIIRKIADPVAEPVQEKSVFTDEQLTAILTWLTDNKQYQKACLVALAMCSGARKSELVRFKTWYFDEANVVYGSLYKTPEKIKTKGRSKQGKLLYKYTLKHTFQPYLDMWMQQRAELGIDSEWLFVNPDGSQLAVSTINSWADTITNHVGMPFYLHALRHYFTSHCLRVGLPENVVQDIVGWSSSDMLRLYDDRAPDESFGEYFDQNGIKAKQATSITDIK